MKFKYFLRGFGVGIVFTAIILAMLHTSGKNTMSDKDIIERAKKLGMIDSSELDTTLLETPLPTDNITSKPTEKVKEIVVTITPKAKETPKIKKQTEDTSKPKKTKKPVVEKEVVSITVESGMWSEKICQKLQELGVVDNAEELDEYLCEKGYASNIQPGIYKIKKGASYEEIAKALMK